MKLHYSSYISETTRSLTKISSSLCQNLLMSPLPLRRVSPIFKNKYLSQNLCGYRKSFSTQTALTMLPEKWKKILGDIGYAGAVLMDLSKAFDTINHELLIAKLHAYGFSKEALTLLLAIYLIGNSMLK